MLHTDVTFEAADVAQEVLWKIWRHAGEYDATKAGVSTWVGVLTRRLAIDRLELEAQDSVASLSGTLPLTDAAGQGTLDIEAEANLGTLVRYLPADLSAAGEGSVSLSGSVTGTLRTLAPNLLLTIDHGLILSQRFEPGLSNLMLRTRIADGVIAVEQLSAAWGAADSLGTLTQSAPAP